MTTIDRLDPPILSEKGIILKGMRLMKLSRIVAAEGNGSMAADSILQLSIR